MATYPSDATADITAFSVIGTTTYNNTGSTVEFALPSTITTKAAAVVTQDGVTQDTTAYNLSSDGTKITFGVAPNATTLVVKTISLPSRFRVLRSFPSVKAVDYNSSALAVNGNTYTVNGSQEFWSLPFNANVDNTSDFMVYVGGVFQQPGAYTYPSVTLGNDGIDIGDNSAVKLLTNFADNLTDSSDNPHTLTLNAGSPSYSSSNLVLAGATQLTIPASSDFDVGEETSFTFETIITPDAGTQMSANQTLLARQQNNDNYFFLRTIGANATIGFIVNHGGSIVEAYGGNCNGGSSYNVAVSYDKATANLRLYVADTLVQSVNYNPPVSVFNTRLLIGANNSVTGGSQASQERYKGKIEYIRVSKVAKFRAATTPVPATTATIIGGAPLGAADVNDTLSIRVFEQATSEQGRFTSMADRKPDSGFNFSKKFDVAKFKSTAGYEKRRLKSRRPLRSYTLQYTNVSGVERTAIENFYNARSGEFESFSFDLSHLNESGTITTRFDGDLDITQVLSSGTQLIDNFFTVSFKLQETYD